MLPHERERAQPFEVELSIEADLSEAGASDDLSRTVDYGGVVRSVASIVEERSFLLLEALAQAIASVVLSNERVRAVTVTVRKLRPPVEQDLASAGVTIHRQREGGEQAP